MAKTAVDWFFSELERMQYFIGNDMLEAYKQAKEIEKIHIITAHGNKQKKSGCVSNYTYILTGEEYYNEIYNNN
jgi:hypothetical protein